MTYDPTMRSKPHIERREREARRRRSYTTRAGAIGARGWRRPSLHTGSEWQNGENATSHARLKLLVLWGAGNEQFHKTG
jgi:hypothetical protein